MFHQLRSNLCWIPPNHYLRTTPHNYVLYICRYTSPLWVRSDLRHKHRQRERERDYIQSSGRAGSLSMGKSQKEQWQKDQSKIENLWVSLFTCYVIHYFIILYTIQLLFFFFRILLSPLPFFSGRPLPQKHSSHEYFIFRET